MNNTINEWAKAYILYLYYLKRLNKKYNKK